MGEFKYAQGTGFYFNESFGHFEKGQIFDTEEPRTEIGPCRDVVLLASQVEAKGPSNAFRKRLSSCYGNILSAVIGLTPYELTPVGI